jgi:hypothetical protein
VEDAIGEGITAGDTVLKDCRCLGRQRRRAYEPDERRRRK